MNVAIVCQKHLHEHLKTTFLPHLHNSKNRQNKNCLISKQFIKTVHCNLSMYLNQKL
jgi:hypothetical protein